MNRVVVKVLLNRIKCKVNMAFFCLQYLMVHSIQVHLSIDMMELA